jgi:hypothetical protein
MEPSFENLSDLASQLQRGDPHAWRKLQDRLHPGLIHVVRRALRTGQGAPALTRWLGEALRSLPKATDSSSAPGTDPTSALTSMLCNGIIHQLRPGAERQVVPAAETVLA